METLTIKILTLSSQEIDFLQKLWKGLDKGFLHNLLIFHLDPNLQHDPHR